MEDGWLSRGVRRGRFFGGGNSRLAGLGNVHLQAENVSISLKLKDSDRETYHFDGIGRVPLELSVDGWLSGCG